MIALSDIVAAYQADRRADGLPPELISGELDRNPAGGAVAALLDATAARVVLRPKKRHRIAARSAIVDLPISEVQSPVHTPSMTQAEKAVK